MKTLDDFLIMEIFQTLLRILTVYKENAKDYHMHCFLQYFFRHTKEN